MELLFFKSVLMWMKVANLIEKSGDKMELTYQDKGNYFRGLLILIGRDNIIEDTERENILKIGHKLGYDSKFCTEAVKNFLNNDYIKMSPPKFSSKSVAAEFLKDAIKLSFVDENLHTEELIWVEKVAKENNLSKNWIDNELKRFVKEHFPKKLEKIREY